MSSLILAAVLISMWGGFHGKQQQQLVVDAVTGDAIDCQDTSALAMGITVGVCTLQLRPQKLTPQPEPWDYSMYSYQECLQRLQQ
jgi:hypothetical protein